MERLVNVNSIVKHDTPLQLQQLLNKYAGSVFKPGLGKLKGITAKLMLRPESTPRFLKPRPMPYSLRPKVEETLNRMVREGNLTKVIVVTGLHKLYQC